jgi:hypothetical protein
MKHFNVVLPLDSVSYYFPWNTKVNIRNKLTTPIEIETDKWDVGLIENTSSNIYKKQIQHIILRLGSKEVTFPVKKTTNPWLI